MSEPTPIVHVIDDDAAFLTSISRLLRASRYQVKTFSSASEFLAQALTDVPGCLLVDLQMPGMTGLELQTALLKRQHALPIIFLTGRGDIPSTVQAMRDGAVDFLQKLAPKEALLAAIKRAMAHDDRERDARSHRRELLDRFHTLSPRELEVLKHVVSGQLNKQIGGDLGISERTVKVHRTSITTKLEVSSVAELTRMTIEAGLFRSP